MLLGNNETIISVYILRELFTIFTCLINRCVQLRIFLKADILRYNYWYE